MKKRIPFKDNSKTVSNNQQNRVSNRNHSNVNDAKGRFHHNNNNNSSSTSNQMSKTPNLCGKSAIFPINVKKGSIAYRYDVSIDFKRHAFDSETRTMKKTQKIITVGKNTNTIRQFCYRIISYLLEKYQFKGVYAYDGKSSLFVNQKFDEVETQLYDNELNFDLTTKPINGVLNVSITPNDSQPMIDLSDLSQYKTEDILLTENRSLKQTLEIILSQDAIRNGQYSLVGNGKLYRKEENDIAPGFVTRAGSHRGVKIINRNSQNEEVELVSSIVMDYKESLFYKTGNFLEAIHGYINTRRRSSQDELWMEINTVFRGVRLSPVYNPERVIIFQQFSKPLLKDIRITNPENEQITLAKYYQQKGHPLKHLNYPAVDIGNDQYFPLELLNIVSDQKVNIKNAPEKIMNQVHRRNQLSPENRDKKIIEEFKNLNFNNEITEGFGISVDIEKGEGMDVDIQRLKKPTIEVGKGEKIIPDDDGKFRFLSYHKYYKPAKIGKWIILCDKAEFGLAEEFMDLYMSEGKKRGITFENEADIKLIHQSMTLKDWIQYFKEIIVSKYSFVLMIKEDDQNHVLLKLAQAQTMISTQHILTSTVMKIIESKNRQTLSNIMLKSNIKNGGINYKVLFHPKCEHLDINNGKILVIGYDVSHVTNASAGDKQPPSVVGFNANYGKDPSVFIGDFFYQKKSEKVNSIDLKLNVERILKSFKKNRKEMPETVVIIRDGISEGQFKMAIENELPSIKSVCSDSQTGYKPKFIFIVGTKNHFKRIFCESDQHLVNPNPGSLVVDKIVRPDCPEFYMASHKNIKMTTTTRFIQFSVLINEIEPEVTHEELVNFLHCLCYCHQIVTSPTSLPTPIYLADELATRGSDLFKGLNEFGSKYMTNDLCKLTKMLCYSSGDQLPNVRHV